MTGITTIAKLLDLRKMLKLLCFSIKLKIYIPHPGGDQAHSQSFLKGDSEIKGRAKHRQNFVLINYS